jgi:hypothetical protein
VGGKAEIHKASGWAPPGLDTLPSTPTLLKILSYPEETVSYLWLALGSNSAYLSLCMSVDLPWLIPGVWPGKLHVQSLEGCKVLLISREMVTNIYTVGIDTEYLAPISIRVYFWKAGPGKNPRP